MRRIAIVMGLLGSLGAALLVGRLLAEHDFDPTATVKFATISPEQNAYAEELLGAIVVAPKAGHDGKFYFSQAMDPFYLEPDVHAVHLDRATYRAQRMAYPTLASLGGLLSAEATVWGLIVANVLAMGVGTAFTSLVAMELGISRWFGVAFLLNPGMIVTLNIDGGGIVAMAAMMGGVYYTMKDRLVPAAMSLTVAALARETMLIAAIGLGLFVLYRRKKIAWAFAAPVVAVGAWWLYVRFRLGDLLAQDIMALDLPFVGFTQAFQRWIDTPGSTVDLLMGSVLMVVSILVMIRAVRSPTALGWAVASFAFLGILLSGPVWLNYYDSSRALAPVLTAYVLLVPAEASPRGGQPTKSNSRRRMPRAAQDDSLSRGSMTAMSQRFLHIRKCTICRT